MLTKSNGRLLTDFRSSANGYFDTVRSCKFSQFVYAVFVGRRNSVQLITLIQLTPF